jgi:6-pyruvoyl-tetrahydropterin synthase
MYTVSKSFSFVSKKGTTDLQAYIITFSLKSPYVDKNGKIVDYSTFDSVKEFIDEKLNNKRLKDIFHFEPTPENISKFFFKKFKKQFHLLNSVTVDKLGDVKVKYTLSHDDEDHIELTVKGEELMQGLLKAKRKL